MPSLPDGSPTWLVGAFFVLNLVYFVVTRATETSERMQKLLGPLGRRIASRAERKLKREQAVRADMRRRTDARVTDLEGQVAHLTKRLDGYVEIDEYVVYVITWVRKLRVWAAENDVTFPPPELLTFEEWRPMHAYHGGVSVEPPQNRSEL